MKNVFISISKFAISAALIYYLFRQATQSDDFTTLFQSSKDWGWLTIGFAACLVGFLLGFIRWHALVRALDVPFKLVDAIRLGFIGLFFCVFTIGVAGGDAMRAIYVCRLAPNKKTEVIASVVFDRLLGLLTMVSIAALAFGLLNVGHPMAGESNESTLRYAGRFTMVLATIGLIGFAGLLAVPELQKINVLRTLLQKLFAVPHLGDLAKKMTDVVSVYRDRWLTILVGCLMSVGVNVCFALTIYSIAVGLGASRPEFIQHFLIEPIAMVANSLPLPGGIGGMEAAVAFLYKVLASGNGVIVAFTFRFFMLIVSAIGGLVWLFNRETFRVSPVTDEPAPTPEHPQPSS